MYEDEIQQLLSASERPLSISEVREMLANKRGGDVSYETVKRDLMELAAKGEICAKGVGGGKRTSWIFWVSGTLTTKTRGRSQGVDPFAISIASRDIMSPRQLSELYDRLLDEYKGVVDESMKRGSRFVVICDGKVVFSSDREPRDEEVRGLEAKHGKVCYIITQDLVEESSWAPIRNMDYYPTLEFFLGGPSWVEEEVFERGLGITADFDTGNAHIVALDEGQLVPFKCAQPYILRRAIHLAKQYDYYLIDTKIGVQDVLGKRRCMTKACRGILSWHNVERNPFLLANPERKGFVGRDLMLVFPFDVLLSGRNRNSKVYLT